MNMRTVYYLLAGLLLLSCSRAELLNPEEEGAGSAAKPQAPAGCEWREFTVSLDEAARTSLNGVQVRWNTGDEIALWDNVEPSAVRRFTVVSGGSTTAVISGYTGQGATSFVAAYPYAGVKGRDGDNILLQLPALQRAVADGADASALLSVASGNGTTLTFKNVCALMKVTVTRNDIASLYLTGVSNEVLAGTATVAANGTLVSVADHRAGIALKPASGNVLASGTYVIPVLPAQFAAGFYINAFTSDARQCKAAYTSALTMGRNAAKDAGPVDAGEVYANYYGDSGGTTTSSTLNFYWNLTSFSDREAAKAMPWRAALFRDADCTDPVVSWDIPANAKDGQGAAIFGSGEPRFIFTGLAPDTQYWFRATSLETFRTTKVMTASTRSFTPKTMQTTTASVNDVILAEDFSELLWFGDQVNVGCAGYIPYANYKSGGTPSDMYFKGLSGINPTPCTYQCIGNEARFFREMRNCVTGTRLDTWSEIHELNEPIVCARPGYVKMGASNCTGSLVTPPLDCIPEGKSATIKVSYKAARSVFAEKSYIKVQAVRGTVSPDVNITRTFHVESAGDSQQAEATVTNGWQSFECEITGVQKGDCIAIGGDRERAGTTAGSAQVRFMLDEIVLTVTALNDAGDIPARLAQSSSSTLTFTWSPSNFTDGVADVAHPYTFGLYTDRACTTPVVEWTTPAGASYWISNAPRFIFSGLDSGTSYYFKATATDLSQSTDVIAAQTTSWTNIQIGAFGSAKLYQTILAEDFGELVWYGDVRDRAVGYVPDGYASLTTVKKATGRNPSGFTLKPGVDECRLFHPSWGMLNSIMTTRQKDWAEWTEGKSALSCCHAGYLKLGAECYGCLYLTPRLQSIPADKKAKLRVRFKAARYMDDPGVARIGVFHDDTQVTEANDLVMPGGTYTGLVYNIPLTNEWQDYTYEVDGITSMDRIAIGADRSTAGTTAGTDQLRMLLDEVRIEIIGLSDSDYLVVPLSDVGYMKVYHFRENNQYGMVFCPGGGYSTHSNYEVNNWLREFTSNFTMAMVYYTLPAKGIKRDITLADMDKAVALMDSNRASWGGYTKLGVTGGSAGGHLCVITAQRNKTKLDFQAPQFAVITMRRDYTHKGSVDQLLGTSPSEELIRQFSAEENVTADMPPAYIAYSKDDTTVPYSTNSLWYVNACQAAGAVYRDNPHETGGHAEVNWPDWPSAFITWLDTL